MLGLPIAVVYKYVDDQATYLAVIVTYYSLFAIFPLLLLGTQILGFVLAGDPELQQQVLDSALSQLPIIGDQFRTPDGLTGSTSAVVIGSLAALYGAIGLGSAVQNALNIAWGVPRNSRPNPFLLRLRSLVVVSLGGLAILGLTTLSVLASNTSVIGALRGLDPAVGSSPPEHPRHGPGADLPDAPGDRPAAPHPHGRARRVPHRHRCGTCSRSAARCTSVACWPRRRRSTRRSASCSV